MAKSPMTVIRGGRVVDIKGHSAPQADILVKGDTIVEIGPKVSAPASATVIDAKGKLVNEGAFFALTDARHMTPQSIADWLAQWTK